MSGIANPEYIARINAPWQGWSRNIMTPDVLLRGLWRDEIAWELAEGTGFDHEPIYGVTIQHRSPTGKNGWSLDRRSQMFHTYQGAVHHIVVVCGYHKDEEVTSDANGEAANATSD